MRGRNYFTEEELLRLRQLLVLISHTPEPNRKGLMKEVRGLGFYSKEDFGILSPKPADLDMLVKTGEIKVMKGNIRTTVSSSNLENANHPEEEGLILRTRNKLESISEEYKPQRVRTLFIAEAPPENLSDYFYLDDVKTKDYLFLGIMSILYPHLEKEYIEEKRPTELKQKLLKRFQKEGFFLMYLSPVPKAMLPDKDAEEYKNDLLKRIDKLEKTRNMNIVIIRAKVFDMLYYPLTKRGYKVCRERIPYPSSGRQKEFVEGMRRIFSPLYALLNHTN